MNLTERLRTHTMCPTPEEAADALESLTAERDALAADAARYRFCFKSESFAVCQWSDESDWLWLHPEEADAAIDAAIQGAGK